MQFICAYILTFYLLKKQAQKEALKNYAEELSLEEYKKAYREIIAEEEKRDFLTHLSVYVLVNTLLIVSNLIFSPKVIWYFYPLIGWGIGIVMPILTFVG
ncbi:MAG: 2TM domain-containing protein [Candidatus Nanoarchaeia archaeon]